MSATVSGACTYNGLLDQDLTGSIGGDSYYACGFLSNYTRAATCCSPETMHKFPDPCYSWCDLPSSLNNQIDTDREFSTLDYMQSCLNQTGETIGPLWCRLTKAHVVTLPKTTTESAVPSQTPTHEEYCATVDRQAATSIQDPWPACGMLPTSQNELAFRTCCQPSPAQWGARKCIEWCYLPRGNVFAGMRDSRNLTDDQILGSYKTCMIKEVGNEASAFDGLWCRVNGSAIELGATTFTETKYLMGGKMGSANEAHGNNTNVLFMTALTLLCFSLLLLYRGL